MDQYYNRCALLLSLILNQLYHIVLYVFLDQTFEDVWKIP